MKRIDPAAAIGMIAAALLAIIALGVITLAVLRPSPQLAALFSPSNAKTAHCGTDDARLLPREALRACAAVLADKNLPGTVAAGYYNAQGMAYLNLRQYDQAIDSFSHALVLKPDFIEALARRATAYGNKQDFSRATADIDLALRLNPRSLPALNTRVFIFLLKRDPDGALAAADAVLAIDPKNLSALGNRGSAHELQKDYAAAVADFSAYISLNPKFAPVFVDRGVAYANLQQYDLALADEDKAIALAPKFSNAYAARCFVRSSAGRDLDNALLDCNQAITLSPKSLPTTRAIVFLKLARFEDAITDFDTVLKAQPRNATVLYGRGVARRHTGDVAGADADIKAAEAISPAVAVSAAHLGIK